MKEYQVSYRGNRYVTRDNIIDILNELGYNPGGGGGGFMLKTVTNWYLLAGKDDEVSMPDMDIIGETNWKTEYEAPYPGMEYVWRFTDFCYEDETNLEVPYLHIYTTPELITMYSSGGMGVEFAYSLFNKNVSVVDLNPWKQLESLPEGVDPADVPILSELPAPNASGYSLGNYIRVEEVYYEYSENRDELPRTIPVGDWTKDLNLSYGATQYLWMSQRKISASGDPGQWEKPIRLSGADGDPGADAFDTEFIYKRMGRKPIQDDNNSLRADNERWNDDYVPRDLGWVDNPQGVDNDDPAHKYEWMAYRTRIDSTHDDYDPNHPTWLWSNWSDIKIWSAYGEKGMDGDGVQYIYNNKFVPTESVPKLAAPQGPVFIDRSGISHTWNGDVYYSTGSWYPKDWEDGIFDRWEGGNYNPQGEWIPGGSYNDQGQFVEGNWTDEPQGVGDFEIANPAFVEDEPVSETNPETITVTHPFEWVSTRKRVREVWGPFSEPTLWSTFSREHTVDINSEGFWVIDGVPTGHKAEGEDGKGIDLKGRVCFYGIQDKNIYVNAHELSPEEIAELTTLEQVEETFNLTEDNIGDCYVIEKGRGGRYAGHVFLFLGPDDETGWEAHWYDFGEFQGDGSYVHIAWATYIGTNEITGQLEQRGFAVVRLPDVEYNWMGICTDHDRDDPESDRFTEYKWNYIRGKDGDNFERVYIRTTKNNPVPIISYDSYEEERDGIIKTITKEDDEYRPFVSNGEICGAENSGSSSNKIYQFTDDPKGTELNYPYEWIAERKRKDGEWKNFNTPSIHSNFSHDGQSIIRSTVFKRCESCPETRPVGGDYDDPHPTDTTWSDGLPSTGNGPIWMSSKVFTSDGLDPQDGIYWSDPILLQDTDNLDIELSTQPKDATPLYAPVKYEEATVNNPCNSHVPVFGEDGYDPNKPAGAIGEQIWFDPKLDATEISANATNINWMATRTSFIDPSTGLPEWRDWVIVLIKGEAGAPGKEFQHAYLVYPTASGAPTIDNNTINTNINTPPTTNGVSWTLNTTAGLEVNADESLWMTERTVSDDVTGSWGPPVRISGNGTPGEDAEDIQFVYKRSSTLPNDPTGTDKPSLPEAICQGESPVTWNGNVENTGSPSNPVWVPIDWDSDTNGEWSNGWSWNSNAGAWNSEGEWIPNGWTDSPQGVDETSANKYEWMCQRIKPRTNNPDHTDWGDWSNVFVWSAYGDTGMDGDGVEYIYTRNSSSALSAPSGPVAKTVSHSSGITWKGGVEKNSDNKWIPKNLPTSEGQFQGWLNGDYNPQGEWIPEGSYDNQGQFVEGDWTDEPKGVGEEYQEENPNWDSSLPDSLRYITKYRNLFEWVSQRKRVNGEWGGFSEPTLWSSFASSPDLEIINGVWYLNGEPIGQAEGPAGKGVALKGSVDVIYHIEAGPGQTALQDIYPHQDSGGTWHYEDIAPGDCYVVRKNGHLYLCLHSYSGENAWNYSKQTDYTTGDGKTWLPTYTNPGNTNPNWEDVGEFKGEGSYMHIAWAATNDNIYGTGNITFDTDGKISLIKHYLIRYEDKLPEIDYDWMGVFANNDDDDPPCNFQTGDWIDNVPSTQNWTKYKWNNVRGRDGDNYERVYLRTKTATPPPTLGDYHESTDTVTFDPYYDDEFPEVEGQPRTFQDQEYLPKIVGYNTNDYSGTEDGRCTDDPVSVERDWPYSWMSERRKKLDTTTHLVRWFDFSPPAIWAKYSFDGNNGKSVQTRYVAVPKKTGLTIDQGYESALSPVSTVEGIPYTWQANTSNYSSLGAGMYLWMTQRSTSDPDNDITTEWEIPIRLSGEDGKAGEDGADIEFVYLRNNDAASPPAPANPTAKNKSDNRTTPYYGDVEKVGNAWIPKTWDTANNDAWSNWEWYSSAGVWNNDGEWIPDGWSDNPQGVDSTYKYEWACQRTKSSGTNQNWTQWVGPFKWSAYGDTGMDGDGVEYVYLRWDSSTPLSTPSGPKLLRVAPGVSTTDIIPWTKGIEKVPNSDPVQWQPKSSDWDTATLGEFSSWDTTNSGYFNEQGEWIPIAKKRVTQDNVTTDQIITTGTEPNLQKVHWTDDPQGIGCFREGDRDVYYIREWVSMRKRINGEWGSFSEPKIWASFGSDVKIVGGQWIINGVPSGKAEGEDGQGVALRGSVEVLNDSDRRGYASAHDIADYTTVRSLQGVKPSVNDYSDLQIGDCYVVKDNGYLYTCIRNKDAYDVNNNPNGWIYSGENDANWWEASEGVPGPGQQNWAEVGEIQGAPGESSYTHIAWATDSAIERANDGTILLIEPFITRYEELDQDISYEWMGVCINEHKLDPPNDYDKELEEAGQPYGEYESYREYAIANPDKFNWHLYKWNHVTGKDGSDYEKVYIKTKSETVEPYVDQTAYNESNAGHNNPADSEFYPKVLDYDSNSSSYSNPTFTDDPTGVSADWPYEWVTERRKKLNTTTQRMEWGEFYSPATLWATYSFDGITAYLTKSSDNLSIDAAGNAIGGLGTTTQDANFNPRFYTEVKIYDPKKKNNDNSYGGYLAYQSGTTPSSGHYVITPTAGTNCTANSYNGKVYIQSISSSVLKDKTKNSCSVAITAKIYGGKTFNFTYTVTFNRIPQTYLTYTLTNDSDTFTYRTRTKKYDGLPIETKLEVLTTDGTVSKLNDNTDKRNGYIVSTKIVGKGENNLLKYSKITHLNDVALIGTNIITVNTTNKTVEIGSSVSGNTVSHNTYTVTIYSDSNYSVATGLLLKVKSDGTVSLVRSGLTTDIDLPDTTHNLDISCSAKLSDGTQYEGLVKTFKLLERNDATLYKLILPGGDTFVKGENNSYSPAESNFSIDVNINDESGTTTESIPLTGDGVTGLVRDRVYVKFLNGQAATTPSQDASHLSWPRPAFSSVNNDFFTVVVVEYDASNNPATYHDIETVNLVPPGVSAVYLDINMDSVTVDCDSDGNIIGNSDPSFTIEAYLRWGNLVCKKFSGTDNGEAFTSSTTNITVHNVGYNATTNKNYTAGTIDRDTNTGLVSKTITFHRDKYLESGQIKVRIKGEFENGIVKDVTNYIDVVANRTGGPGPRGDFKSTAFIRTNDSIGSWTPIGGAYTGTTTYPNGPIPTGFSDNHAVSDGGTWNDGIPAGDKRLWSSYCTFYGAQYPTGHSTWSNPIPVKDTETYDVEFALKQSSGNVPSSPVKFDEKTNNNPCNAHRPSGYQGNDIVSQIWYDPEEDSGTIQGNYDKFYWKAEREIVNGDKKPWIITQIKGESEPNVRCDRNPIVIETDPTGKLSSDSATASAVTIKTWLRLGETIQSSPTWGSCLCSLSSSSSVSVNKNSGVGSDYSISWTITPIANTVLTNTQLTINMVSSACSATKTIDIVFERKNQSQVKSFIFKRFASQSAANSGVLSSEVGSFTYPSPGGSGNPYSWNGWSDGLPTNNTDPIYMSSRLFTSDGLSPQQYRWSTPVKMSDTEVFDVEFSPDTSNDPGTPPNSPSSTDNWYDPNDTLPGNLSWEDMVWMATRTKNSSGSWGSWKVMKIKGETGNTGTGIKEITTWYKAFDTLDIIIPDAGNTTDGWTLEPTLTSNGWSKGYVRPTKENPYLWKFTRTEYQNPTSFVHDGLEMIQVWSENMINPNLLDDTDFIDDNHIGGWNKSIPAGTEFYPNESIRTASLGNITGGTTGYYDLAHRQYYVKHKLGSSYTASTSGTYIVFLSQTLYDPSNNGVKKINTDSWYTLSFDCYARYTANSDETQAGQTLGIGNLYVDLSKSAVGGAENITWTSIRNGSTTTYSSTNASMTFTLNSGQREHWTKIIVTFKTKSSFSSASGIEFKLSPLTKTNYQCIYITEPKLEIGKVATDYISGDAIKDPYPRLTVWGENKQYYQGKYGEPYLDAVTYGTNWFRCRNTHISNNSNKPVMGQTTAYWEPAQNLDFIVTDLLLAETAFIKDLSVGGLRTGETGKPRVEMFGNVVRFYGNFSFPSIELLTDNDGVGILRFYSKNNEVLYDLGPNGISKLSDGHDSTYTTVYYKSLNASSTLKNMLTISYRNNSGNSYYEAEPLTEDTTGVTPYYKLTEGTTSTGNIIKYRISNGSSPSDWNGKILRQKYSDDALRGVTYPGINYLIGNGWYATIYSVGVMDDFISMEGDSSEYSYTPVYHMVSGVSTSVIRVYYKPSEVATRGVNAPMYEKTGSTYTSRNSLQNFSTYS